MDKKFIIENCVNEFFLDKVDLIKLGYCYWFVDKDFIDGCILKLSVVMLNQVMYLLYIYYEDEFFFILEGRVQFYLNGKIKVVGLYISLYCFVDSEYGISNVGDMELKYFVIKKYLQ